MTAVADELRSIGAAARKAAEHYRANPDEIARGVIVDVYNMIARLAEQLARPAANSPGGEFPYWRARRPPPDDPPGAA
jgi:hypothetical protein